MKLIILCLFKELNLIKIKYLDKTKSNIINFE